MVKQVLKSEIPSVSMKDFSKNYRAPSVLGDENRFFNREMEEVKKTMFFK